MSSLTLGSSGSSGNAPSGYQVVLDEWKIQDINSIGTSDRSVTLIDAEPKDKSVLIIPILTILTYVNTQYIAMSVLFNVDNDGLYWGGSSDNIYCTGFLIDGEEKHLYARYGQQTSKCKSIGQFSGVSSTSSTNDIEPLIDDVILKCGGWSDFYDTPNMISPYADADTVARKVYTCRGVFFIPVKNDAVIKFRGSANYQTLPKFIWGIGHLETIDDFYNN